jgi:hypothetical protein
MKKVISLMLILILSFGMISSSFATSKVYDQNYLEIEKVEENIIDDTTTKFTTVFNNGIEEIFYVRKISSEKTEIYDSKNQLVATISEKIENLEPNLKSIDTNGKSGTYYSNTSPYRISDYVFQEKVDGDIHFSKAIKYLTITGLGRFIDIYAPGIGKIAASMIIGSDMFDIFSATECLYYTRWIYYHKNLGSLEKMYKTRWFYDKNRKHSIESIIINYSHFN